MLAKANDLWRAHKKVECIFPWVAWATVVSASITIAEAIMKKYLPLAPLILITLLLGIATLTLWVAKNDFERRAEDAEFYGIYLQAWENNIPQACDSPEVRKRKRAAQEMLPLVARVRRMNRLF